MLEVVLLRLYSVDHPLKSSHEFEHHPQFHLEASLKRVYSYVVVKELLLRNSLKDYHIDDDCCIDLEFRFRERFRKWIIEKTVTNWFQGSEVAIFFSIFGLYILMGSLSLSILLKKGWESDRGKLLPESKWILICVDLQSLS